jgi:hypothetical protein
MRFQKSEGSVDIKGFIEKHIPQMDSPEKVYQLFEGLGYKILDTSYKGKKAWDLRQKDSEVVEEIYTIANYNKIFQAFLVKLKYPSSSIVRELPLYFERETQYPFFVLTPDYQNYTFVLVEKIREDVGVWKRKLIKLNLDRESAFYTDKWILSEIAIKDGIEEPVRIYGLLKEAFGVQKVTKKFFSEYKENFDLLSDSLKKDNKGVQLFYDQEKLYAFVQRFLGRLMFLYFLQKKGWLAGDKKFIPNWFERFKKENRNFYQNVLEPLFFDTLNRKRPNDDSPFGKIPFLNGGLFEKDYGDLIYIPDKTIEKILNFLNSYNFTISEELPLEVEVAVNPEMLGRIFESMLPEYERGKKGTFYTPRPIVHYMCRESLKDFLFSSSDILRYKILNIIEKTETKDLSEEETKTLYDILTSVRILDPAVGSGAFLVGMMQEIIRVKTPLAEKLKIKITPAQLKREIIKSNIYGIDIETEAIEIAKLRLWLSLVVDEELEKVEPLPNLDYKLAVGNSLVESFQGRRLIEKEKYQQTLLEDETQKLITEFRKLKDKLLEEMDPEKKNKLRSKLEDMERRLIEQGLKTHSELKTKQAIELGAKYSRARMAIPASEKKKMDKLIREASQASTLLEEIKKTGTKPFFLPQVHFAEAFSEKGGFDIVIANPPYVRTQKLSDLPYREDLQIHYGYVDDLYVHFTFRAFELARPKGVVTFITSDTYLTLSLKERMRQLLQDHHIQRLILTPKAFQATVNTAIYIVQKEKLTDYNFTFIDAREIGSNEDENWEDKLIVFEELKEIESYDTHFPIKLGDKEIEVSHNRYADVGQFRVPTELYKKAVKRAFFVPTRKNLKLYEKFMPKMNDPYQKWWDKIKSSKDIQKNKREIEEYIRTLRPGDITLLGLITEGGQGLATADNGRFLAVLEGTEEARRIEERLRDFERRWQKNQPKIYKTYQELLKEGPRNDALDGLRKKFEEKKLGFPRGFVYKVIKKEDVFYAASYLEKLPPEISDTMRRIIIFWGIPESAEDMKSIWKLSKLPKDLRRLDKDLKGIIENEYEKLIDKGKWIDFVRGGEAENIYWSLPDRFIDWGRNSVKWLSTSTKARWQGYEHFFQEGITYIDVGGAEIKARILHASIYDHTAHSFFPDEKDVSTKYLLGILNTPLASYFANEFLNHTMHFELNDIRLFPIVIPTESQRKEIEALVYYAVDIQKKRYSTNDEQEKSRFWQKIQEIQREINEKVEEIYGE